MRWKFVKYPWQVAFVDVPDAELPVRIRPDNGSGVVIYDDDNARDVNEFASFLKAPVQKLGGFVFVEFPGPSFRSDGLRDLPIRCPGRPPKETILLYEDAPSRGLGTAHTLFHEYLTGALQELSAFLFDQRRKTRDRFLELPLAGNVAQFVTETDDDLAARALICDLAQHIVPFIEAVVERPRQVLQRKHALVRMDRMQEMDIASLIDYARRPGRTAAVKAGDRQQLKAVIREETANTLENRVVHDFCFRVISVARHYLSEECNRCRHRSGGKCASELSGGNGLYSECKSKRVMAVRVFGKRCEQWIQVEPLTSVTPLKTPCRIPNYALQQNVRYVRIWDAYQRLLRQEDVLEQTWRWKRRTWSDLVRVWAIHAMNHLKKPAFRLTRKHIRIRETPEYGCWLKQEPFDGPLVFENESGAVVSLYLLNRKDVDLVFLDSRPLSLLNADFYWVAVSTKSPGLRVIPVWAMIGDARWMREPETIRKDWAVDVASAAVAWGARVGRFKEAVELVRLLIIRAETGGNADHRVRESTLSKQGHHVTFLETNGMRETFPELTSNLVAVVEELTV